MTLVKFPSENFANSCEKAEVEVVFSHWNCQALLNSILSLLTNQIPVENSCVCSE